MLKMCWKSVENPSGSGLPGLLSGLLWRLVPEDRAGARGQSREFIDDRSVPSSKPAHPHKILILSITRISINELRQLHHHGAAPACGGVIIHPPPAQRVLLGLGQGDRVNLPRGTWGLQSFGPLPEAPTAAPGQRGRRMHRLPYLCVVWLIDTVERFTHYYYDTTTPNYMPSALPRGHS